MKFRIGDFVRIQGHLAKITKIKIYTSKLIGDESYKFQIKFTNDPMLHWVELEQLQEVTKQIAPKVLFG